MLVVMCFLYMNMYANDVVLFKNKQEGFLKLIQLQNKTYLITAYNISQIDKNHLVPKAEITDYCNDAVIFNNKIVFATKKGLSIFNANDNTIQPFLNVIVQNETNHVAVDELGRLWYSEIYRGCYMIGDNNQVFQKIEAPVIYALTSTPDSNVWVGTNVGMYKIPPHGSEVYRFVEEGLEGFELPDNLVERIFADETSNVWAVMPGYISFIPSSDFEGEIPNYSYVGNKENTVFDITKIPVTARSYLFSTNEGLIYTANIKGDEYNHAGEIHQVFHDNAVLLGDDLLKKPTVLKNNKVIAAKILNKEIYFITENGLWSVPIKNFISALNKKFK